MLRKRHREEDHAHVDVGCQLLVQLRRFRSDRLRDLPLPSHEKQCGMAALTPKRLGMKPTAQAFESTFAEVPCRYGWSLSICQTPCRSWTDWSSERPCSRARAPSRKVLRKQSGEYIPQRAAIATEHALTLRMSRAQEGAGPAGRTAHRQHAL